MLDSGTDICYTCGMYIEFVIVDNFLLTYLAGAAAARLCHNRVPKWRIIVAAILGTAAAVFYPFMNIGRAGSAAVKLALGAALCAVMFARTVKPLLSSALFFGCTFAFGGSSYALGLILYGEGGAATAFSVKYPLFLTLGCGCAVYAVVRIIWKRLSKATARAPYEYDTDVEIFGATLRFSAFLDTGNCVCDGKTGLPVVITGADVFTRKLTGAAAAEFLRGVDSLRSITVKTAAGEARVRVVEPDKITVYSHGQPHRIEALIGLVGADKRFGAAHEMLLNPIAVAAGV